MVFPAPVSPVSSSVAARCPNRAHAFFGGHVTRLAVQRLAQRFVIPVIVTLVRCRSVEDHAGADRHVGDAIDHDERTRRTIAAIAVEAIGLTQRDRATPDFIQPQRRRIDAMQRIDVDLVAQRD